MIPTTYPKTFEVAINKLLQSEGGYVDHPNDSGKATNFGITKASLEDYNTKHGHDWTTPTLTRDQAREFYFDVYWVKLLLDQINFQELQNVVLATAVNRGVFSAIHSLQVCAKMPVNMQDGKMGPRTIAYANAEVDQKWLVNVYCDFHRDAYKRMAEVWYAKDPEFDWRPVKKDFPGATQKNKVFEKGWINRINAYSIS